MCTQTVAVATAGLIECEQREQSSFTSVRASRLLQISASNMPVVLYPILYYTMYYITAKNVRIARATAPSPRSNVPRTSICSSLYSNTVDCQYSTDCLSTRGSWRKRVVRPAGRVADVLRLDASLVRTHYIQNSVVTASKVPKLATSILEKYLFRGAQ